MTDSKIGENIRKIRELKGFSQDYMASQLAISQRAYSNIESGNRKIDKEIMDQVANALDIDPLRLITFDEKFLFNNCSQSGLFMMNNIHWLAEKEREALHDRINDQKELYEKRITELKEEITFLRSLVKKDS